MILLTSCIIFGIILAVLTFIKCLRDEDIGADDFAVCLFLTLAAFVVGFFWMISFPYFIVYLIFYWAKRPEEFKKIIGKKSHE